MSYSSNYKGKENVTEFHEHKAKSTPIAMVAPEVKHNADFDTEITKTCAVLGCEDSKTMEEESFFRFPEDSNLRQVWTGLTGRNSWTPTDYSYICIQHFSVDCFKCDANDRMVLVDNAVPSLKLPGHVLEVEYIDEDLDTEELSAEYLDTDEYDEEIETKKPVNGISQANVLTKPKEIYNNVEVLKLFTEVQKLQNQAIDLKGKLKRSTRAHHRQNRFLNRLEDIIERKKKVLELTRRKKSKILLSLQDKINEDMNGLVLAMPVRQTEDLKNFALGIYKYSPQAYIYIRNTLRTMLPSTDILDSWLNAGYQPKNVMFNPNLIKIISEQTDTELLCKVSLG